MSSSKDPLNEAERAVSQAPAGSAAAQASQGPGPRVTALLVALLCLIWGSTWLVIKTGLRDVPPFTGAATRFFLAAVLMCPLVALLAKREGGERPRWWVTVSFGISNVALSYGIVYWAETQLDSGLVSVLWAVFPMLMALFGHFMLPGERLATGQWLGFAIGFVGVACLFLGDLSGLGPDAIGAALILLISPTVCALGQIIVKRYGAQASSLILNRDSMFLGAALLGLVAWRSEAQLPVDWTPAALGGLAYLSIIGSVVGFGLYFWLLRFASPNLLSLIAYVTPAIALWLGWLFGDESLGWQRLLGTGLILVGIVAVRLGRR